MEGRSIAYRALSRFVLDLEARGDPDLRTEIGRDVETASSHGVDLGSSGAATWREDDGGLPAELPPYEAEYGVAHVFLKSQVMADVAGFYRAFGVTVADAHRDRPDHLATELEFMHFMVLKTAMGERAAHPLAELCRSAMQKFFAEHLAAWAPAYFASLSTTLPPPGSDFAAAAERFLIAEAARFGSEAPSSPLQRTPSPRPGATDQECALPGPDPRDRPWPA